MALIVIGGHTRNIGKTSVVAGLIASLPQMNFTAIKITQFGHNVCSANGEPCDCQTPGHTLAISEERNATCGLCIWPLARIESTLPASAECCIPRRPFVAG